MAKQHESIIGRDQNAAKNLERSEDVLRKAYPGIRGKRQIRLGIQIGRGHKPETYSKVPVTVINLVGERSPELQAMDQIDDLFWEDAPIEKLAPLFMDVARYRKP